MISPLSSWKSFLVSVSLILVVAALSLVDVVVNAQEFTLPPSGDPTSAPPASGFDPRVKITMITPFPPTNGSLNGPFSIRLTSTTGSEGTFLDLGRNNSDLDTEVPAPVRKSYTQQVFYARKLSIDPSRLAVLEHEVFWNETGKRTTFILRFLDPPRPTTAAPPGNQFELTTETPAPPVTTLLGSHMSNIDIARKWKADIIKYQLSYVTPYRVVGVDFQNSIPDVPATQEAYTPVPTINEEAMNVSSFGESGGGDGMVVAIAVSTVIGVLALTGGVLGYKSWAEKKALQERPSGFKWKRDEQM